MRIDLVAPPMAGHLHPVLGIGMRLAAEPDLDVRVISTPATLDAIGSCGLPAAALLRDADARLAAVVEPPYRLGSNPRLLLRQFRDAMALQAEFRDELVALWDSGDPPDLVIADFTLVCVGPAAEERGLTWWTTHPSPCAIEGRSGPPAYLGGWRPGRTALGRARDAAGRAAVHGFKRLAPRLAGVRPGDLGVDAVHRPDGSEAIYSPDRIFALTPAAIEYPRDLPAAVRTVGPVLTTPVPPSSGPAPSPAPRLAPGRRHVLLTAGTHLPWHKTTLVDAAIDAAHDLRSDGPAGTGPADVELHVSLGGDVPGTGELAEVVEVAGRAGVVVHAFVDYQRHLPGFDAVVHHGGSGVLGHTLAAGLPAVVWPVDYDQADNAVRLVDAGVAVALRRPDRLADRIARVLDDPRYGAAARRVAADIHARPAVEAVLDEVRAWAAGRG